MRKRVKIKMIVDLQFGSTGKGLIAGYMAEHLRPDVVVTANMPNAGHTYIDAAGRTWIHKVLPNGIVSPNLQIVGIGPGAVFDIARLRQEVMDSEDILEGRMIVIHEAATVLLPRHTDRERASLSVISSTMQGSMAAMVEKMGRDPTIRILAGQYEHEIREAIPKSVDMLIVSDTVWASIMKTANYILAEGAQGYSLGISAGFWPYCTSRDCTPARFMSDMQLPMYSELEVIGTARTFPIRVGNTSDGNSGPHYSDQKELTWAEVGQKEELTTVTKRVRRVFTFSMEQMVNACVVSQPQEIFLNFCNYMDEDDAVTLADKIELHTGVPVRWMGWGPGVQDISPRWISP